MSCLKRRDESGVRGTVSGGGDEVVEECEERGGEKEGHGVESLKSRPVQQAVPFLTCAGEMARWSSTSHSSSGQLLLVPVLTAPLLELGLPVLLCDC